MYHSEIKFFVLQSGCYPRSQKGELDAALHYALVNDQVDFVKLFMENGVSLQEYLTIEELTSLYNEVKCLLCNRPVISQDFSEFQDVLQISLCLKVFLKEEK